MRCLKSYLDIFQELKTLCWGGPTVIPRKSWIAPALSFNEPEHPLGYGLRVGLLYYITTILLNTIAILAPDSGVHACLTSMNTVHFARSSIPSHPTRVATKVDFFISRNLFREKIPRATNDAEFRRQSYHGNFFVVVRFDFKRDPDIIHNIDLILHAP
jgi:hypothetical protein